MKIIIVSACLIGINCKYNGKNNRNNKLAELVRLGKAIPVCPEQLGGLPTPRLEAEIKKGTGNDVLAEKSRVYNKFNNDVTSSFLKGAQETLNIAKNLNAKMAILKEKSPSCGSNQIYDGTFSGNLITGEGVTTALLRKNGIKVFSEKNCAEVINKFLRPGKEQIYIGVIGASSPSYEIKNLAYKVGQKIALRGAILVCGGRTGVMESAAKGAKEFGGFTVGILPGNNKEDANPYIDIVISSGIGEARNAIITRTADALIAIGGGYGTLSEIGLALKMNRPVIGLNSWKFKSTEILNVASPDEAVEKVYQLL